MNKEMLGSQGTPDEIEDVEKNNLTQAMKDSSEQRERILKERGQLKVESLSLGTEGPAKVLKLTALINGHHVEIFSPGIYNGTVDGLEVSNVDAKKIWQKYVELDWDTHNEINEKKVKQEQDHFIEEERQREINEKEKRLGAILKDLGI